MSEVVHIKGEMKLVEIEGNTLEDTCMLALQREGADFSNEYELEDNPYELQLTDQFYNKYVVFDNDLLEVISTEDVDDKDVFYAKADCLTETVHFELKYYDGGCSMSEALCIALQNLVDTDNK